MHHVGSLYILTYDARKLKHVQVYQMCELDCCHSLYYWEALQHRFLYHLSWSSTFNNVIIILDKHSISINVRENLCMMSGFHHVVDENCVLLGYYTASSGNCLMTYRDNLSVPSSRINNPIGCPETLIRNYRYLLHNNPEECSS